jgi:diguanylate cyclase
MHLLQRRTSYDALTGLPLRRVLDESFDNTVSEFAADGLYLLLLDIDHFKKINDNYGHLIGDDVLRAFALQLEDGTRRNEPVYRYGGEEFIILLHATCDKEASIIAKRLRESVAATDIKTADHRIHITFSAGLSRIHAGESLHEV